MYTLGKNLQEIIETQQNRDKEFIKIFKEEIDKGSFDEFIERYNLDKNEVKKKISIQEFALLDLDEAGLRDLLFENDKQKQMLEEIIANDNNINLQDGFISLKNGDVFMSLFISSETEQNRLLFIVLADADISDTQIVILEDNENE